MTETIKLLDVVALTVDLPEYNLWRGQVGTVVEILAGGKAYEVEFCDREGRTYESVGSPHLLRIFVHYLVNRNPGNLKCKLSSELERNSYFLV